VPTVSMKDLLQSGVHFGHQTRRWNPKMRSYIFTERGGIYIIDLQKTTVLIDEAYNFLRNVAARGGSVLFVGTKKQCQDSIKEEAEAAGQPYVASRWLGGLLTNYVTLSKRIKRLHELRQLVAEGSIDVLPTRDQMKLRGELAKLETNLGGVAGMETLPSAVFVVDPRKEAIVVKEARKLGIPLVALVDTNCDPDEVDYVIPGNDDAIRSCSVIVKAMARAVADGRAQVTAAEFKAAEERAAAAKVTAQAEAALAKAAAAVAAETGTEAAVADADAAKAKADAAAARATADAAAVEKAAAKLNPVKVESASAKVETKPAEPEATPVKAEAAPVKADAAPAKAAPVKAEAAPAKAAPVKADAAAIAEAAKSKAAAKAAVAEAIAAQKRAAEAVENAVAAEAAADKAIVAAADTEAQAEVAAVDAIVAEAAADEPKKTRKPAARRPAKADSDAPAAPADDAGARDKKDESEA
jgi:small subunit ribosomal protein S2